MSKNQDITTKYNLDVSGFKKGIAEANQAIKLANAQFKASSASMDDWSKSTDGIKAKLKQLDSVLTAQKIKLESYQKQHEEVEKAYQENGKKAEELKQKMSQLASQGVSKTSTEFQKYQKALNEVEKEQEANKKASDNLRVTILNQQAVVNKIEREMNDYEDALKDVEKAEKLAAKSGKTVEESLQEISQEADQTEENLGGLSEQLSSGIKKGFAALATAAAGLVTAFLATGEASQEFIEDMGKLETSFTTSGHSAETAKKTYQDFVGILGETDQSVEAVGHLAKLTKSEQELAEWTGIAAGVYGTFGDSLPIEGLTEAANETAKVGQVTGPLADALNWAGMSEDEFNKKLASTNSEQERATLITQTLTGLYGDAGQKYQEVNKDLIEARKATSDMNAAMADMGTVAMPIVTSLKKGFANFLKEITPKIQEFVESVDWTEFSKQVEGALKKVADGFGWILDNKDTIVASLGAIVAGFLAFKVVTIIQSVTSALKGMTLAQAALNLVMSLNPIGLIVAAIAGLVTAIVILWNKSETFRNFWIGVWEAIKNVCSTAWEAITGFFTSAWETIKSVWEGVTGFFSGIWEGIKSILSPIAQWFYDVVIAPIWQRIQFIVQIFTSAWTLISQLAQGCWNLIKAVWSVVSKWFNEKIIQPVTKFFTGLWNGIKTAASNAWNGIKAIWSVVSKWFNEKIIQPVKNVFTPLWNALKTGASNAWNGIKEVFSKVASFFKSTFEKAWTAVKNVFSTGGKIFNGIKDGIVNAFKTTVNAIIRGINKVVKIPFEGLNKTLDKLQGIDVAGVKPFNGLTWRATIPQIPELAKGGVLKKGQVGLLEGNGSEAVVPLERNKYWIKEVANQLKNDLYGMTPGVIGSNINVPRGNNKIIYFTQTNNSPKPLNRLEIYRQTNNALANVQGVK